MTSQKLDVDCKFTGKIEHDNGRFVIEIPQSEVQFGTLEEGDICRISINKQSASPESKRGGSSNEHFSPPVSVGERRTVEIEDMGDQGDGITRVDRGYVLIVPETEVGDEVTVEVESTNPNYGFATVVENREV
jgi:predicted RNA-binding protein with TRAM domain